MHNSILALAVSAAIFGALLVIVRKAGYSGWWILLAFVPPLNVVMLVVFALWEWPIQRQLARLRVIDGSANEADFDSLVAQAVSADQKGEWTMATQLFDLVVANCPDPETQSYAADSVERVREKIQKQSICENSDRADL